MSHKNRDQHGRWRTRTIGFRVSEEENTAIDEAVALSGLTKQDYIIAKLLDKDVVVVGNPRVFKALKTKMGAILTELYRLKNAGEAKGEFLETLNLVTKVYAGMVSDEGKEDINYEAHK